MKVAFTKRVLASGALSDEDKKDFTERLAKDRASLVKIESSIQDAIDGVNSDYKDSPAVKDAIEQADSTSKELSKDEKELERLRKELADADDSSRDQVQANIDQLQEKIAKKSDRVREAKIEIASLEEQMTFAKEKKDSNAESMLQKILDNKKAALKKLEDE